MVGFELSSKVTCREWLLSSEAQLLTEQAFIAMHEGNIEYAKTKFRKALAIDSESLEARWGWQRITSGTTISFGMQKLMQECPQCFDVAETASVQQQLYSLIQPLAALLEQINIVDYSVGAPGPVDHDQTERWGNQVIRLTGSFSGPSDQDVGTDPTLATFSAGTSSQDRFQIYTRYGNSAAAKERSLRRSMNEMQVFQTLKSENPDSTLSPLLAEMISTGGIGVTTGKGGFSLMIYSKLKIACDGTEAQFRRLVRPV